ncbi:hypothetical protein J2785_007313 [Burkholderia ambifaria]|nr:DUF6543 domain-containing protein [Burkholderia ambifaria]MDR6504118.1 hypothetical protein [Burkholderia ambifaria]
MRVSSYKASYPDSLVRKDDSSRQRTEGKSDSNKTSDKNVPFIAKNQKPSDTMASLGRRGFALESSSNTGDDQNQMVLDGVERANRDLQHRMQDKLKDGLDFSYPEVFGDLEEIRIFFKEKVQEHEDSVMEYWNETLTINAATDTRKFHVAEAQKTLLSRLAEIGVQDGTLTKEDQARVDLLRAYPDAGERNGEVGLPGVYAIKLNVPLQTGDRTQTEISGSYVITERQSRDSVLSSDVGVTLLVIPGRPIERFDSMQQMNDTLEKRLNGPAQQSQLLQHVDAKTVKHMSKPVMLTYDPIPGNLFQNRLESQIDRQRQDLRLVDVEQSFPSIPGTKEYVQARVDEVVDSVRVNNDMGPYLAERDLQLVQKAIEREWPDWMKTTSAEERAQLQQYAGVNLRAEGAADHLMQDVASPHDHAREQTQEYLKENFGIDIDPDAIRVNVKHWLSDGATVESTTSLTTLVQEGPRDTSWGDVTYTVTRSADSPVPLTDVQLKQTLGELDVRKDYGAAVETTYRQADVKNALADVLDTQIQMDAFSAKMQGHLTQSDYDMVQRARDPAKTPAGATTQVSVGSVSIHLPGKAANQMKDALVFRETKADGQVERYILYVPNSPDGQTFYGFNNWRELSATMAEWAVKPEGRQYLQDQLDRGNRSHATHFFEDAILRSDAWRINENGTAIWTELPGTSYQDKLDAAVAEKSRTRVAEAKVGTISPDWYEHASPAERQQLTSLADRIRATKQAMSASALPDQPFPDYAHGKVKESLNHYLRTKGVTETVDPDTVMVDLGDGTSPRTLTDVATYGYDSSDNFVGKATFTSSTGQDLSQLNTAVPGAEQGARRRGAFAEYMDPLVRGGYLGEQYTREVEQQFLTEGPALEQRRALYREHVQSTMLYDAAQAKLRGELTAEEYTSVKQQIDEASLPASQSPGTRMLHRLTVNGRPVEGAYVFRGVGAVGHARNMLYTPGAPDGRTFRPYDDSTFRSGKDEPRSLTKAMADYYFQRVKYSDQPVAATRLEKLQKGQEKPDALSQPVSDLSREYDRKLQLALDPVRETTKTRGQIIREQVWKGIEYTGAAISLVYPPASIPFSALMWGKEMHDAYGAYWRGDRAAASRHILSAGAEAIGFGFDSANGLKALGRGPASVRKALGLKAGQHFGTVEDAASAAKKAAAQADIARARPTSVLDPALAVQPPASLTLNQGGLLDGTYAGPINPNGFRDYYIKDGERYFQVKPDAANNTLRLVDPRRPNAYYQTPVALNADGQWQFNPNVGLRAGAKGRGNTVGRLPLPVEKNIEWPVNSQDVLKSDFWKNRLNPSDQKKYYTDTASKDFWASYFNGLKKSPDRRLIDVLDIAKPTLDKIENSGKGVTSELDLYRTMDLEEAKVIWKWSLNKDDAENFFRNWSPDKNSEFSRAKQFNLALERRGASPTIMPINNHLGDLEQAARYADSHEKVVLKVKLKKGAERVLFNPDYMALAPAGKGGIGIGVSQGKYFPRASEAEGVLGGYVGIKSEDAGPFSLSLGDSEASKAIFQLFVDNVEIVPGDVINGAQDAIRKIDPSFKKPNPVWNDEETKAAVKAAE